MANSLRDESIIGDPEFANLIDELTEQMQSHRELDLEDYLVRYPQYADQLEQLVPAMEMLICQGSTPGESDTCQTESPSSAPLGATGGKLGDFRITREIGRGGMGVVYEVEQLSLKRRMALKVLPFAGILDEQALKRFKNEALAAATLNHPNIVQVHSVGCDRGVHYYAMQLIEGQTLADTITDLRRVRKYGSADRANETGDVGALSAAIATGGFQPTPGDDVPVTEPSKRFSIASPVADTERELKAAASTVPLLQTRSYFRTVANLGIQAADALAHAHANGILHRDIKPANLMIDGAGKLWVTDFGLARIEAVAPMTMTGDMLGTLRYMCPEMAAGGRERLPVDQRTDIYSLGVTLYELLTLEPAFEGKDRKELFQKIIFSDPRPPRRISKTIPANLETIVLKAMRKDPTARYATASELAKDLRHFLDDEPIRAKPPTLVERTRMWSRRNRTVVGAAAILLVLITMGSLLSTAMIWQEQKKTASALEQSEAIVNFLINDLLGSAVPERASEDPVTVEEVLANAEEKINTAFRDQPVVEASVRHTMGRSYSALGNLDAAHRHLETARELRIQNLGITHRDTLKTMNSLALVLRKQGEFDKSLALHKQTCELQQRVLGPEDRDTLSSMHNIAWVLYSQGELEIANAKFKRVLELQSRVLGLQDRATLRSMNSLAHTLRDNGDYDEAVSYFRQIVDIQRSTLGEDNLQTLATMDNLGGVLTLQGKFDEAIVLHQEAFDLHSKSLGPEHSQTLSSMTNLAYALSKGGELEKAQKLYERCLKIRLQKPGREKHPETLFVMHHIACLLNAQKQVQQSHDLHKKVLALRREVLGTTHPDTLKSMNNLANTLSDLGRVDDAIALHREALDIGRETLASGHPSIVASMINLGRQLRTRGKFEEAYSLIKQAAGIQVAKRRFDHPLTVAAFQKLGYLLENWQNRKAVRETTPLFEEVIEARRRTLDPDDYDTSGMMSSLGNLLSMQNRLEESVEMHEQTLAARRRTLGPDHGKTLDSMHNLSLALQSFGKYEEARVIQEELVAAYGDDENGALRTMYGLAITLMDLGEFEDALSLAQETFEGRKSLNGPEHLYTLVAQQIVAESLQSLGRWADARQEWNEIVEQADRNAALPKPLRATFLRELALNLASYSDVPEDDRQRAIQLAQLATELDPNSFDSWRAFGAAYAVSSEWKKSLEAFNKAIDLDPNGQLLSSTFLERLDSPDNQGDEDFQQLMEFVRAHSK